MIDEELISKIKKIPIEGFLPDRFRQSGGKKFYLCPFPNHNETKPSFVVYTDTNTYFCFGEQRGGDVIKFIMDLTDVNFQEAVCYLEKYI